MEVGRGVGRMVGLRPLQCDYKNVYHMYAYIAHLLCKKNAGGAICMLTSQRRCLHGRDSL